MWSQDFVKTIPKIVFTTILISLFNFFICFKSSINKINNNHILGVTLSCYACSTYTHYPGCSPDTLPQFLINCTNVNAFCGTTLSIAKEGKSK